MKRLLSQLLRRASAASKTGGASLGKDEVSTAQVPTGRTDEERDRLARLAFEAANDERQRGELALAEKSYREALRERPEFSAARCNLGALLRDLGRSADAEEHFLIALDLDPQCAPAAFNLAMIRIEQGKWIDAARLLRSSAVATKDPATCNYWLGNALMGCGDSSAAHAAYKRALRIDANFVQARWGLAMSQLPAIALSETEQTIAVKKFKAEMLDLQLWFHKKENRQGFLAVGSQQPYYLAYIDGNHREVLSKYGALCCDLMGAWQKTMAASPSGRQVSGKVRVGIVSAHIHSHSVWHALVRGWLEHLSPRGFELHVFYVGPLVDSETRWAQSKAFKLHHGLGPWQRFAEVISASGLDALIYPEVGIDAATLRLAALRLAPIQLAAWGHPITTGLPTIDGYLTADAFEPEASATHYSERVFSLPHLGCCYRPFGTKPVPVDITQWGMGANDTLLICPGTPMKYAPQHDGVWIEIARRCAGCKLIFFQRNNDELSRMLEARLRSAFARQEVNFDACVRFIPWQNQASFFGLLNRAAVVLDTVGFSGFNTTMQAVERGVPMVAFDGQSLRGRFASGILKEMGLAAWVADTTERYVQLVVQLATDPLQRRTYADSLIRKRDALFGDAQSVAALGGLLMELCEKKQP